jgi:6-phosphogluconolactonase/glucosamine-6-phosphate isomerase/deaminase
VIHAADAVIVLVTGAEKAAAVARALEGAFMPDELPIQLALSGTWFVDENAASKLGPRV